MEGGRGGGGGADSPEMHIKCGSVGGFRRLGEKHKLLLKTWHFTVM